MTVMKCNQTENMIKTNNIKVELVDSMGDDLSVVNAARVSMDKTSSWEENEQGQTGLSEKDQKLIGYLAKHKHFTPFTQVQLQYRITAPIFVARQWFRSNVGITRNEVSRRYVDTEPEFFFPEVWRSRAPSVKQGSSPDSVEDVTFVNYMARSACAVALEAYDSMLSKGVAPELARMVLPQNMFTEWVETASLQAVARICLLRLDSHAQVEIQDTAKQLADVVPSGMKHSFEALLSNP
jgi:thymidylate synthase (FAD)